MAVQAAITANTAAPKNKRYGPKDFMPKWQGARAADRDSIETALRGFVKTYNAGKRK